MFFFVHKKSETKPKKLKTIIVLALQPLRKKKLKPFIVLAPQITFNKKNFKPCCFIC